MKQFIVIVILLSFATPVRAGLTTDFDPVERKLLDSKQTEERLNQDFRKQAEPEPIRPGEQRSERSGSSWWKWALGILVVGGLAAAAGGGEDGSSTGSGSSTGTGGTGSTTVTW